MQVKSLTSVPHVNRHSDGRISWRIICLCIRVKNITVLCVIKVSNLEIALCSMQGMIWKDTDAVHVGIYMLLSWIYFHTRTRSY